MLCFSRDTFLMSLSLSQASKAAVAQFFDTLRVEFGSDIKVTIVTPGFIESEMIQGKFLFKGGKMEFDPDMRDVSYISYMSVFFIFL